MLYHIEVSWPDHVAKSIPNGKLKLRHTLHAINAAQTDRYGEFTLPLFLDTNLCRLIEAEYTNRLEKFVCRIDYDAKYDLVLVVGIGYDYFVKTAWLNAKSDNHKTLKRSKYAS